MRRVTVLDEHKRNTKGVLPMTIGLLLIAAALLLVFYNIWDARRAELASAEIAEKLEAAIPDEETGISEYTDSGMDMPTVEIDGYEYIGILDIPVLNLHLPVMAEWDYERLKISPCRYSGSYYLDNMVICAHNYAKHFSPVKWVDVGADVYFTAADGHVYHYQVIDRETVKPAAVETMIGNSEGGWDMTLFTCNTGGQTRCAVRCARMSR